MVFAVKRRTPFSSINEEIKPLSRHLGKLMDSRLEISIARETCGELVL
jgi:hypothetical protein